MKKFFFIIVCAMTLMVGCTNKGQTAGGVDSDSLAADSFTVEVRDTAPKPMFLYYFDPDHMQVVYWTDAKEPDRTWYEKNDMLEYYDEARKAWECFDAYRRNATGYTQMLLDDGKSVAIRCIGEQLKNPDGEDLYPGELHSRPTIPSMGMNYAFVNIADSLRDHAFAQLHVIVHEAYMNSRRPLTAKLVSQYGKVKPLSKTVISQLEEQYGMKTERSEHTYTIGDRYTYGVLQFKPKNKKVFALEVVTDGDKVYSYPVEGHYDESEANSTWNVDDDGEYASSSIGAAFEGPEGLELCFEHRAPESATVGMLFLRDGKLLRNVYEVYHQLIDEQTPLWKKDLATCRKFYLDNDPHENKNYRLSRYRWIDVDGDYNEELWMRDEDNQHGALFTVKGGDIGLIGVETDKLHLAFLRQTNGKGYVRISGSAGGPAIYTQVFELKNSCLERTFTALEVYGELDECTMNGKPWSKDKGKEYLSSLPPTTDPFIYWLSPEE